MKKLGGIFVPPYTAVIHQYMRECAAGGGRMILGSDSHTRYGLPWYYGNRRRGTEIARQALGSTYDIRRPPVIAVKLSGAPVPGVGPMDVALTLIGAVFDCGFCKNKILEVVGDGIANLSMEYRMGIDVMTTETAALSSIWMTDETVREWLAIHGREDAYEKLEPTGDALYDGLIEIDLSSMEPMIALPFHPSNVYSIRELCRDRAYLDGVLESVEKDAYMRSGLTYTLRDKIKNKRLMSSAGIHCRMCRWYF
ncbi:MAG: aconitase family protein [Enterocloster bolteae]